MAQKISFGSKTLRRSHHNSTSCAPIVNRKKQLRRDLCATSVTVTQLDAQSANFQWRVCTFGAKSAAMEDISVILSPGLAGKSNAQLAVVTNASL